jgi:short-subunit dehydrogenase
MNEFAEKYGPWVLITGASSGIGAAFARQLAGRGLDLVLVARRADRLQALAEELRRKNSIQARVVASDLSREDFMPAIVRATEELDVHLLVNSAGAGLAGKFLGNDLDAELSAHFGRLMQQGRRGGVIFMGSVVAFAGTPAWSHYAATKAHNLLFAEGLAAELRRDGVDVLALCPGFTRTELLPLTRFGRLLSKKPDAVVRVALKNIGRKPRVTAGLLSRIVVLATRLQPRRFNTWILGTVFNWAWDARAARSRPVVEPPAPMPTVTTEPAPAPQAPTPPSLEPQPIVVEEAADVSPDRVVEVLSAPAVTRDEPPAPQPAAQSAPQPAAQPAPPPEAQVDEEQIRPRRRRPRYTPPPKSAIRSKQ